MPYPVPMYPFVPIEKPTALRLTGPPKFVFCVHVLLSGSYSQKSFLNVVPVYPVPIYPFVPIEKPTASHLAIPPKSAFCVHVLLSKSYSQKSLYSVPSNPVPIYNFVPIVNPTAPLLAVPPKSAFCVHWENTEVIVKIIDIKRKIIFSFFYKRLL